MNTEMRMHIASLPNGDLELSINGNSFSCSVDTSLAIEAGNALGGNCLRRRFVTKADIIAAAINGKNLGLGLAGYTAISSKINSRALGLLR